MINVKTVVILNIFVEAYTFFRLHRWIESSKEHNLFEIEIYIYKIK